MQQEVEALLALQQDDLKIREIEAQIRALDPQLAELDKRRDQAAAALVRAQTLVQTEEKKQRELQARLAQHKTMQERNLHQLEDVKRRFTPNCERYATATALTYARASRKFLGEYPATILTNCCPSMDFTLPARWWERRARARLFWRLSSN